MRHPSWDRLLSLIDQITEKHGGFRGVIHDYRCGKDWDGGQAICAELYGPSWQNDPQFKKDDAKGDSLPVPDGAIAAAERVLAGVSWMQEADDGS